jgi:transposase
MTTLSLDIRQRILARYDDGKDTRDAIAKRFCVSLGMVKKLIQQRKHLGEIGPLHYRAGRKPTITQRHNDRMEALIAQQPDITLAELRNALRLNCSLTAIHKALAKLGLTYKKRRSGPASRNGRM